MQGIVIIMGMTVPASAILQAVANYDNFWFIQD